MAWCMKCGGVMRRKGISYGNELFFCQCAQKGKGKR
jgi:hypothetical protein